MNGRDYKYNMLINGHTKFTALPSLRSSAVGGMVGWRIGRSRPSDELAEEDLSCACGMNVVARGFKI